MKYLLAMSVLPIALNSSAALTTDGYFSASRDCWTEMTAGTWPELAQAAPFFASQAIKVLALACPASSTPAGMTMTCESNFAAPFPSGASELRYPTPDFAHTSG